jgi:ATP-dependent RNA helicase SUPV3L1/SUV3
VRRRLGRWLDHWLGERLGAIGRLRDAALGQGLTGAGRGIAYRLVEAHGAMRRADAESLIRDLAQTDRRALARLGVRFGRHHVFVPDLLKPAASEARTRLSRIFHGRAQSLPPPGRTVLRSPFPVQGDAMLSVGFAVFVDFAVRIDMLERIAARLRAWARDGVSFSVPPTMAAEAGLTRAELARLVEALGFRPEIEEAGTVAYTRPAARRRDAKGARRSPGAGPAHSPFAVLAGLQLAPRA